MVDDTRCPLKELYQEFGNETLASIRDINLENKLYQHIREKYQQSDRNIAELCGLILYENGEALKSLKKQVENERRKAKEYDKQSG
jgi:hypothetical protein